MPGSIRQDGPNKWRIRVSAGRDPLTGKYTYASQTIVGGKRDAQRAAAQLVSDVKQGVARRSAGSLGLLLEQWMANLEVRGRAASTLCRYKSAIDVHILPALGHKDVAKLNAGDIDAFYAGMIRKGLNPLSVRKCHAILSASLHQAVRWGWIDRSPVDRATPPSSRAKEIVPPTVEEVRRLLDACEGSNEDLASLVYVAVTTGCRRGELCGLQWGDIDFVAATLVVVRSITDATGESVVKDTKTHQARRLALDLSTLEVLRRQRLRAEERAAAVGTVLSDRCFVWSQEIDSSQPYRPDRVSGAFIALRDRAGVPHVTFHGLRHFAATVLAGSGVGVRTIAGRLGHTNPSLTLRTYAHFLDAADREAAAVMAGLASSLRPRDDRSTPSQARGTDYLRPAEVV